MIADQYDAMRTQKPYKQALRHEEAFKIITEGNERTNPKHFDPQILNAFIGLSQKFDLVYSSIKI
jgi:putative two-component system response regulator